MQIPLTYVRIEEDFYLTSGGFEDMEQYKKEFIEFMIDCEVLRFGDFVTKSGRKTPFFL